MTRRYVGVEEEQNFGKAQELLTDTAKSGQKVVPVADGTTFAPDMKVRIIDDSASEENEIDSISTDNLTMKNDLTNIYTLADNARVQILPFGFIDVVSESLTGEPGVIYPDHSESRETKKHVSGPWAQSGGIETVFEPENICRLLKWLTGLWVIDAPAVSGGGSTTLDGAASIGDRIITIDSATGFTEDDFCKIGTNENAECRQIIDITGKDFTLDYALKKDHDDEVVVVECEQVFKHVFTPAQDLKSFLAEVYPGVGSTARQIVGLALRSLTIEAVARELVTGSFDLLGRKENILPNTTPTFSPLAPFVFHQASVEIQEVLNGDIEAFRITYENVLADDHFVLGSRFLPRLEPLGLNVTGELDLAFLTWEMYQRFYGLAAATEIQTILNMVPIMITLTGPITESEAVGYVNYLLKIELPETYFNTSDANFDRRERTVQNITWTAVYNVSEGYLVRFTIVNKQHIL